MTFSCQ